MASFWHKAIGCQSEVTACLQSPLQAHGAIMRQANSAPKYPLPEPFEKSGGRNWQAIEPVHVPNIHHSQRIKELLAEAV
jgi:hypothetical protein